MERIGYLRKLLIETGVDPSVAGARARIMNWCYLGYVLSANELNDESLKLVIRDLTQLARLKGQVSAGEQSRRHPDHAPTDKSWPCRDERLMAASGADAAASSAPTLSPLRGKVPWST